MCKKIQIKAVNCKVKPNLKPNLPYKGWRPHGLCQTEIKRYYELYEDFIELNNAVTLEEEESKADQAQGTLLTRLHEKSEGLDGGGKASERLGGDKC